MYVRKYMCPHKNSSVYTHNHSLRCNRISGNFTRKTTFIKLKQSFKFKMVNTKSVHRNASEINGATDSSSSIQHFPQGWWCVRNGLSDEGA